jgi:Tetracyclin repressor-like, C-terminal domain
LRFWRTPIRVSARWNAHSICQCCQGFTFDYHADHPDFVRLVMIENIHHARHLKMSAKIGALNSSALNVIRALCDRGMTEGVFRPGIDPVDIHLTISALCFYNVSNRASIKQVFDHDMGGGIERSRRRASVIDTVLRFARAHLGNSPKVC